MKEEMKDVRGKVFLVTGGAMGIGRMVAERFARDGARVVLWDIDRGALEETSKSMKDKGWEVHGYLVDVTDRRQVYETAEMVKRETGVVDILFNNAGVIHGGPFLEVEDEEHFRTMDVNFNAYMWTTRAFLPDMIDRGRGHIINIASSAGLSYVPLCADYCASKAAVVMFTDAMRLEMKKLGHRGVHFTIVCPGLVSTGLFEGAKPPLITPWMTPERIADKIYQGYHRDKEMVAEPFMVKLGPLLRAITTRKIYDVMTMLVGLARTMDEWRGREKSQIGSE